MNNANDILEAYKSLLKYFDSKGYFVFVPDGAIKCVEISNSPSNEVEIRLNFETVDTHKNESGKYDVFGKYTFTLSKSDETDPKFADQIMNDMKYFLEHFSGMRLN